MATMYRTPGVYIEEIPRFPPSIAPVETAIPAFIGYTEKAEQFIPDDLLLKPKRIGSLAEYELYFGTAQPEEKITISVAETQDDGIITDLKAVADLPLGDSSKHIMFYALQMYFDNGGGPCYIVSVAKYKTFGAAISESDLDPGLKALEKFDEPTLIVFPEAQNLPIADFKKLQDAALAQCQLLKDRFVIMDVNGDDVSLSDPDADLLDAIQNFRDDGVSADNLKYGAAYAPNLFAIIDYVFNEAKIKVSYSINGGAPDEFTLGDMKEEMNAQYEVSKAAIRALPCILPPSSSIAGIYAAVDGQRGVWKSPGNVSVKSVIKPSIDFTNTTQDQMNVDAVGGKSVNAIRSFTGKGTLVWGARTLAGNDLEWRYISVRRFFNFVEESVKKATETFVFEPNDANTWVRVQAMIENFLTTLWRQGALQGIKPEHAFYVAVGLGKTMTAVDILEGRMIIEIGMAAVRPAEFIILRFSHKMAES